MSASDANAQPEPLAYTIRELAHAVRCSERTIRRAISSGQLNVVRIGRCVRVPRESLKDFLSTNGAARHAK
jgi:excisionase family DNA binding protein